MSERGVFAVDRGIFDDPFFLPERYTRRLAYLWVLAKGSVPAKPRWLADRWGWQSAQEVRRFLRSMYGCGLFAYKNGCVVAVQIGLAKPKADPVGWTELRAAVFARDGFACTYCGSTEELACDHVHPASRGGPDSLDNLTTACRSCNSSKRDRLLADWNRARHG